MRGEPGIAGGVALARRSEHVVHMSRGSGRGLGKGHHAARLNLGDLFTYALADAGGRRAIPCVGDDFAATDMPGVPGRQREAATG